MNGSLKNVSFLQDIFFCRTFFFAGQAAVLLLPSRAVPTQTFFPLKRDGNKCELEISNLSSMLHALSASQGINRNKKKSFLKPFLVVIVTGRFQQDQSDVLDGSIWGAHRWC